jgi:serine O-acetyltransferase
VEGRRPEGPDADWIHLPDPIADAMKALATRIAALERAVDGRGSGSEDGSLGDGPAPGSSVASGTAGTFGPNPAGG